MFGAVSGDPAGKDLAPFRDKMAQGLDVLVIDLHPAIRAKDTDFSSLERPFLSYRRFHLTAPPSVFAFSRSSVLGPSGVVGGSLILTIFSGGVPSLGVLTASEELRSSTLTV
jgi:hypothetical protein